MASNFQTTFNAIKLKYDEVFKILDSAVRNEEDENPTLALIHYKKGIRIIDEALSTPVSLPADSESVKNEWTEACKMIHKLKRARAETLQRIGVLSEKLNTKEEHEEGAASVQDWTIVPTESGRPRTYTELAQALREMQYSGCNIDSLELIFSCDGVKLYHIKPNGVVTTSMEDSTMRIVRMEKDEEKHLQSTFFIQIIKSTIAVPINCSAFVEDASPEELESENSLNGHSSRAHQLQHSIDNFDAQNDSSWIYPLVPGVSPCFRTEYGAFIFPDLESLEPGASFGIIIPSEDKNDEIVMEILESILHGVVIQGKEGERKAPKDISEEVSENIVRGANFVSQNLIKGAEKTGKWISYTTPYLLSKIRGAPNDAPPVSENVQKTVTIARNVTGVAAGATGYIAGKVGSATMALGRFLAPHIQKHGSTLLSRGLGLSEQEAQEKMNGVLTIAAGAVEGFGTVYSGLEESAKILGKNLGENSVKIIEHKYGPSAGSLAAGTVDTVGNVINLSQNINYITPKGLAKKTAKNAGKAIVQSYRETAGTSTEQIIPANALYPNLSCLEAEVKK